MYKNMEKQAEICHNKNKLKVLNKIQFDNIKGLKPLTRGGCRIYRHAYVYWSRLLS
jgi:hypothetical protein